jgi:hypothetical protein
VLDETGPVERCQIEGTLPMLENNDKGVDQTATSAAGAIAPPPRYGNRRVRHGALPARGRQLDANHREVRGA